MGISLVKSKGIEQGIAYFEHLALKLAEVEVSWDHEAFGQIPDDAGDVSEDADEAMDKYKPPSPYIEHIFRCSLTSRDPNPDSKRYERMLFWDEIMETHIRSTEAALRMSHELEKAIRQKAKESNSKEANQETNAIQTKKEE